MAAQRRRLDPDGAWSFSDILGGLDAMGLDELEQLYHRGDPEAPAAGPTPPNPLDDTMFDRVRLRMRDLCPEVSPAVADNEWVLPSRDADTVPDVGRWLAPIPSAVIDDLAANHPRAFLTEPAETTDARTSLHLFENHTRCLRGTSGTNWFGRLAPWAGTAVDTVDPDNAYAPALHRTWRAADNQRRTYMLGIFRQTDAFYVVVVLASDDGGEHRYVGAFYMQSTMSHEMDLHVQ